MSSNNLSATAEAVLVAMKNSKMGTDVHGKFITRDVLEYQFTEKRMPMVEEALKELLEINYIEGLEEDEDVFRLTPYGANYLSQRGREASVSYSNINNANIAHQSEGARQSISIGDLPNDIKKKISELNDAVSRRDSRGIKRAFGYIADKAVDVAIAIATGRLTR